MTIRTIGISIALIGFVGNHVIRARYGHHQRNGDRSIGSLSAECDRSRNRRRPDQGQQNRCPGPVHRQRSSRPVLGADYRSGLCHHDETEYCRQHRSGQFTRYRPRYFRFSNSGGCDRQRRRRGQRRPFAECQRHRALASRYRCASGRSRRFAGAVDGYGWSAWPGPNGAQNFWHKSMASWQRSVAAQEKFDSAEIRITIRIPSPRGVLDSPGFGRSAGLHQAGHR